MKTSTGWMVLTAITTGATVASAMTHDPAGATVGAAATGFMIVGAIRSVAEEVMAPITAKLANINLTAQAETPNGP